MRLSDNATIRQLVVGQLQTNCYILADQKNGKAIIIDPGDDAEYIENVLRDLDVTPIKIIATHGHFDHILAAWELQQVYKIPFLIHAKDRFLVKRMRETAKHFLRIDIPDLPPNIDGFLGKKEVMAVGKIDVITIETSGHTPGSVCFYLQKEHCLFTGDTLFAEGGVGRTDFTYSSSADLQASLKVIFKLPQSTTIYPGHGQHSDLLTEKPYHLL